MQPILDQFAALSAYLNPLSAWVITYLMHSTVLLALAWLTTVTFRRISDRARELTWRIALFGPLVTSTVALFMPGLTRMPSPVCQNLSTMAGSLCAP